MEKNYYEILEVDKNASKEIIDKTYKILVKRYHPDLQDAETKKQYEEKIKKVNEAYSVISNEYQRSEYDKQLEEREVSKEEYEKILKENILLKEQISKLVNDRQNIEKINREKQEQAYKDYNEKVNQAVNQAYQDAYVQDLKDRGYKIKFKRSFKEYIKIGIKLIIIIIILILIFQIPFIKNFFINLYESNIYFRAIVDVFKNTFSQGF